jgi:hypothetical protein
MKFGFYLKHDDFVDLVNKYNINKPGSNKGLVILLKIERKKNSRDLKTQIRFKGVEGPISNPNQEIPDIKLTTKIPCPYPPPCKKDAKGNLVIDFSDPGADCYRPKKVLNKK